MRHFMAPAVFTVAGFAAGISLVLSCSGNQTFENTLETIGLEETTSSAEDIEDTCSAWRVFRHEAPEVQFDPPPGEFPFATMVSTSDGTKYVITRRCLD
jgi:hypothetical protein